jgi:hypothetical protein
VLEIPSNKSRTDFVRLLPAYDNGTINELHVMDPLQTMRGQAMPTRKIFYEKGHGHLTPFGNRVLTDFFLDRLLTTGWLP